MHSSNEHLSVCLIQLFTELSFRYAAQTPPTQPQPGRHWRSEAANEADYWPVDCEPGAHGRETSGVHEADC